LNHYERPQLLKIWCCQRLGVFARMRRSLVAMALACLWLQGASQSQQPYDLGDSLSGFVVCPVVQKGEEAFFDGPFSFESSEPIDERNDFMKALSFKGNYDQGVKHSNWSFSYRILGAVDQVEINGYRFSQPANGSDYRIHGNFKEGLAHGEWSALHLRVENSFAVDTNVVIFGAFNNGVPAGAFKGVLNGVALSGQFTPQGLVDGLWVFKKRDDDYTEYREFSEGVLKVHYFVGKGQKADTVRYVGLDATIQSEEDWREVDATGMFFDVMQYTNIGLLTNASKKAMLFDRAEESNQLMRQALYTLKGSENGGVWTCLPGSEPLQPSRARLRYYPYSDADVNELREALERYDSIVDRCRRFFDDPVVDIGRYSYEDVAYYYEVFNVYEREAKHLRSLIEKVAEPAFEYLDRSQLFPSLMPEVTFPKIISYEFKDSLRTRDFQFPVTIERSNGLISLLSDYSAAIQEELTVIETDVDLILEKYKQETKLAENEKELVELRDAILARFNMELDTEDYNSYHADVAETVSNTIKTAFKRYGEKSIDERSEEIDALLSCYQGFLDFFEALKKLPLRIERIEEAYTRTLWNPYTYTYMDERVKERVYRAYEQVILPAVLSDFQSNLTCETVKNKPQNMVELYNRMLSIRETDTKVIERQLRRVNEVDELLEILEIKLNFN